MYLGKKSSVKVEEGGARSSKGDRWRQKTKQLKKLSQPSVDMDGGTDAETDTTEEEGVANENGNVAVEPKPQCHIPRQVQIVDAESHLDGIRPYTVYILLVTRDAGGGWAWHDRG